MHGWQKTAASRLFRFFKRDLDHRRLVKTLADLTYMSTKNHVEGHAALQQQIIPLNAAIDRDY